MSATKPTLEKVATDAEDDLDDLDGTYYLH